MINKDISILVIDDEKEDLDGAVSNFKARLNNSTEFKFDVLGERRGSIGIEKILQNPLIQVVVLDWHLHEYNPDGTRSITVQDPGNPQVLLEIKELRPEITVIVMTINKHGAELLRDYNPYIDGYFYKSDNDFDQWAKRIISLIHKRSKTPFFDALMQYVQKAPVYFHTPGVGGGSSLTGPWTREFLIYYGSNYFFAESSATMPPLDSLLEPHGPIREAQEAAARAFGAWKTYFITTGTSTSNKIILQSCIGPNEKVLIDRNCHKSMHYGIIMTGCNPVYLDTPANEKYGLYCPASIKVIRNNIAEHHDAKLLILTSPTFDGLRYDLKTIIKDAHDANINVLVDEAWYAFGRFHHDFHPTALQAGADYVTQSTHKTLSAFRQASMIHINNPRTDNTRPFDEDFFMESLHAYMTTSPHYGMIASLDVARMQMEMEGYKRLSDLQIEINDFRQTISIYTNGVFRAIAKDELIPEVLRNEGIQHDNTKILLDVSGTGMDAENVRKILMNEYSVQVNKYTHNTLLLLCTIGTTHTKFEDLKANLLAFKNKYVKEGIAAAIKVPPMPTSIKLKMLPRDAFFAENENIHLLDNQGNPNIDLIGKISAFQVTPYPPGIPILVPGQEIDNNLLLYICAILARKVEIHGLGKDNKILRVVRINKKYPTTNCIADERREK